MIANPRWLYFVVFLIGISSCNHDPRALETLHCGAEELVDLNGQTFFETNGPVFDNANTRSDEEAFKGDYSVKLNKDTPYGMTFRTSGNFKGDDVFELSVWRKGDGGGLVAQCSTHPSFSAFSYKAEYSYKGWDFLKLVVMLPPHLDANEVRFFVHNPEENDVYFDEFTIKKLSEFHYPSYTDIEPIKIDIDRKGVEKLEKKRKTAFVENMLISSSDDFVTAKIKYGDIDSKIEMRLKGDWTDHLRNDKWSFRVKLKGKDEILDTDRFSLHTPKARAFILEWAYHKMLIDEGILTTEYDFVPLVVNGKSLGIYAIEEHFENELLHKFDRPSGVILRYSEAGFWNMLKYNYIYSVDLSKRLPEFEASQIEPFRQGKTFDSDTLKKQFLKAQKMLDDLRYKRANIEEIFDLEYVAKMYAIVDMFGAHHGVVWHNMRFYYNDERNILEPIAYDGHPKIGAKFFLDDSRVHNGKLYTRDEYLRLCFFNNDSFIKHYKGYIEKYSDSDYIGAFMEKYIDEIGVIESYIVKEFEEYKYDYNFLYKRAEMAHLVLDTTDWDNWNVVLEIYDFENDTCILNYPIEDLSVQAYQLGIDDKVQKLNVINYYCKPIEVMIGKESNPVLVQYDKLGFAAQAEFEVPLDVESIGYKVVGDSMMYSIWIKPWAYKIEY